MAESNFNKYICTEFKKDIQLPGYRAGEKDILGQGEIEGKRRFMEHVFWMDSEVLPGAFYAEAVWFWPPSMTGRVIEPPKPGEEDKHGIPPHAHTFPELLSYYGTDMKNPKDLGCEVEIWIEDEKYVFDKSFVVYVPENIVHCPIKMHNMTKPLFHFTMGPGEDYV